jgi:transcriptional regulator with XRE-family HTH domain
MRQKNLTLKAKIVERYGTQADFSSELGLNENILSRILNGRRPAKPDEAQAIAKALKCKPEELFGK